MLVGAGWGHVKVVAGGRVVQIAGGGWAGSCEGGTVNGWWGQPMRRLLQGGRAQMVLMSNRVE